MIVFLHHLIHPYTIFLLSLVSLSAPSSLEPHSLHHLQQFLRNSLLHLLLLLFILHLPLLSRSILFLIPLSIILHHYPSLPSTRKFPLLPLSLQRIVRHPHIHYQILPLGEQLLWIIHIQLYTLSILLFHYVPETPNNRFFLMGPNISAHDLDQFDVRRSCYY